MKDALTQKEKLRLWTLLGQARDVVRRGIQKELGEVNVTSRQAAVLLLLQDKPEGMTPAEISRKLFRERHTISAVLSRMERQGLLSKTKNLDRKNLVRVTLTEEGYEVFKKTNKRETLNNVFSCLSKKENQELIASLNKIKQSGLKELGIKRDTLFSL